MWTKDTPPKGLSSHGTEVPASHLEVYVISNEWITEPSPQGIQIGDLRNEDFLGLSNLYPAVIPCARAIFLSTG